jgi:hypothetical protein
MLQDGHRTCDVCGAVIPNEEKYVASKVPQDMASLFLETMDANPELAATTTPDSEGNLRLDICLECHINMSISDTPTVN